MATIRLLFFLATFQILVLILFATYWYNEKREWNRNFQMIETSDKQIMSQIRDEIKEVKAQIQEYSTNLKKFVSSFPTPLNSSQPSLLMVQAQIYKRRTILNPEFVPFEIHETTYMFNNSKQFRRTCQNQACKSADWRTMLQLLLDLDHPWEYLYWIEDDTFFCSTADILFKLMEYGLPIILTGIGATGLLMKRSTIQHMLTHARQHDGLDMMISIEYLHLTYRFYMNLNVHLYEGSLSGHKHGTGSSEYPTCFEVSCQNYHSTSSRGHYDWYDLGKCKGIVEKCSEKDSCMKDIPQVSTDISPICAHFCASSCENPNDYAIWFS